MERRNFIRNSSASLAALLLHDQLFAFSSNKLAEQVNVGVIGCGNRGVGLMHVLKELQDKFKVTSICDVLDFRFREAKEVGLGDMKEYKDYRKLLDDKSIKAVVIATPLYLHYQMAADALKAGKHIYLEKTMTYSIDEAANLAKLAKQYPAQVLQVGHQLPYTPLYIKVKEMIAKDYLGQITQVSCRYDRHNDWRRPVPDPKLERAINWRMYKEYS
ncbi:MAG: Gfo/Idh/MocA family oxidoreductase, partial [Chitinophagaceae bacterium]|nr:Gfo/Idh/MocA family oxidoreductase [Chitinophagaceae bacterium]